MKNVSGHEKNRYLRTGNRNLNRRACREHVMNIEQSSPISVVQRPYPTHSFPLQQRRATCYPFPTALAHTFATCDKRLISKPRSGELRTQKLKYHFFRTQSLKVLPLKPGEGQYTAIHAILTARDFFLADFYPSSLSTCIFSKTSPKFFCVGCCG